MRFEIKRSKIGKQKYRFRMVSDGNNKVLASSEKYVNEADCESAIQLIKDEAATAAVVYD